METPHVQPNPLAEVRLSLTPEQEETADLLTRVLGKSIADRYVDFCRLAAGAFPLRVASPIAGHALRELESIFRQMLAPRAEQPSKLSPGKEHEAREALRAQGYGNDTIDLALKALQPKLSHPQQITAICRLLGLAEDGDVAKAWLSIYEAHSKAHERPFNRALPIDDAFRAAWTAPFDIVVRGIATSLQARYSVFMLRVEELVRMGAKKQALNLFRSQIPGAMPLQWHFFQKIEGPDWLLQLEKQGFIAEPQPRSPDEAVDARSFYEWPVGIYLKKLARCEDAKVRSDLRQALEQVASAKHPDVRRDLLEIISLMPSNEAAEMADWVIGCLSEETVSIGFHHLQALILKMARAGEAGACLKMATAIFKLFERDGSLASLFPRHMYEHAIQQTLGPMTECLGIAALKLYVDLLYQGALLNRKIKLDPPRDLTSISRLPLPLAGGDQHDIFDALVGATFNCAAALLRQDGADVQVFIAVLLSHSYKIFQRIALKALAIKPAEAPAIATSLLMDAELLENPQFSNEYAELAVIWYPQMSQQDQDAVLALVDAFPGKCEEGWRHRVAEQQGKEPTEAEVTAFRSIAIRDVSWRWRSVLPTERQRALQETVGKHGDPDAWRTRFWREPESSPLGPEDFDQFPAEKVAEYLASWKRDSSAGKHSLDALAHEFYGAVQRHPARFSVAGDQFGALAPIHLRRFFDGLKDPTSETDKVAWAPVLALMGHVLHRAGEPLPPEFASHQNDPSWEWALLSAAQLLRNGLVVGDKAIDPESAEVVQALLDGFEGFVPAEPDSQDFDEGFRRDPLTASVNTILGVVSELSIFFAYWLDQQPSSAESTGRIAPASKLATAGFLERALGKDGKNGWIVRAILGKWLRTLAFLDDTWTRAHLKAIFDRLGAPEEPAWSSHLVHGFGPAPSLVEEMRPLYQAELERWKDEDALAGDFEQLRRDRFGEYLAINYLTGVADEDLLNLFWTTASTQVRSHVISFLGRELQLPPEEFPAELRSRAFLYIESRIAAAETASDKDQFGPELSPIALWPKQTALDPGWLVTHLQRVFQSGVPVNHAYSVIEWAAELPPAVAGDARALLEAIVANKRIENWTFIGQEGAIRSILTVGDDVDNDQVEKIVSHLSALGQTGFLDLLKRP